MHEKFGRFFFGASDALLQWFAGTAAATTRKSTILPDGTPLANGT